MMSGASEGATCFWHAWKSLIESVKVSQQITLAYLIRGVTYNK